MLDALRVVADRLVGMVVPRTTAGACACFPGDFQIYCTNSFKWRCALNCYCNPINCEYIGRC